MVNWQWSMTSSMGNGQWAMDNGQYGSMPSAAADRSLPIGHSPIELVTAHCPLKIADHTRPVCTSP
jgi:hypothetical protein